MRDKTCVNGECIHKQVLNREWQFSLRELFANCSIQNKQFQRFARPDQFEV